MSDGDKLFLAALIISVGGMIVTSIPGKSSAGLVVNMALSVAGVLLMYKFIKDYGDE